MAPVGESTYFPPLEQCLEGDLLLLSWKDVFTGLSQPALTPGEASIRRFLTDYKSIELLAEVFWPVAATTPETTSSFETVTAAINITPSKHARYDINQMKHDSVWLSKLCNIDEISALRYAIIEWQTRSSRRLLHGVTEGGNKNGAAVSGDSTDDTDIIRRSALLETHLSEQRYKLKTCEFVLFDALHPELHPFATRSPGGGKNAALEDNKWLKEIASKILSALNVDGVSKKSGKHWVLDLVKALEVRIEGLERGSSWRNNDDVLEDLEISWHRNQILEIIHLMQITLSLLSASKIMARSDAVLSWFRLMKACAYFESFDTPFEVLKGVYDLPLQSLVALNSLAILNIPVATGILNRSSSLVASAAELGDAALYILNPSTVNELNDLIFESAEASFHNASLAVFAWGIILQTLREYALSSKDSREYRQAQRALDSFNGAEIQEAGSTEGEHGRRLSSPQRRSSITSDTSQQSQQSTLLEELLDRIMDTPVDGDPIGFLAKSAVDGTSVFDIIIELAVAFASYYGCEHEGESGLQVRVLLLDLVRAASEWVGYQPKLIQATLAILSGLNRPSDVARHSASRSDVEPAHVLFQDGLLMQRLYLTSMARFPYEISPFLQLSQALAVKSNVQREADRTTLDAYISTMTSYTCVVPQEFGDYEIREADDGFSVELTSSLDRFGKGHESVSRSQLTNGKGRQSSNSDRLGCFSVPTGTVGTVLTPDKPLIVMWHYTYSGWSYLGMLLQRALRGEESREAPETMSSTETVSDIISLFTRLLISYSPSEIGQTSESNGKAEEFLEHASSNLERNEDIISVVFGIFESQLQTYSASAEAEVSLDVIVQCIHFAIALLKILPGRVWPFLGRSIFLGPGNTECRLSTIVIGNEMTAEKYEFLIGCLCLFDELITDAITHAVPRLSYSTAVTRFQRPIVSGTGISEPGTRQILLSFEQAMVGAFGSLSDWKFLSENDRFEVALKFCQSFTRIVNYCFGIDDSLDLSHKISGILAPAAEHLAEVFLLNPTNDLSLQPVIELLLQGMRTPSTTLPVRGHQNRISSVVAILEFTHSLVRLNGYLTHPPGGIEELLFKAVPLLTSLYAAHSRYRTPILRLLSSLVENAAKPRAQPPSLLGHLGKYTVTQFLDLLSDLEGPLDDEYLANAIWDLLASIVSQRQQWFAIIVLTGSTPRTSLRSSEEKPNHTRSLFQVALSRLTMIEKLSPMVARSILNFVALSIDFWPWTMKTVESESGALDAITAYLNSMHSGPNANESSKVVIDYNRVENASIITRILAMYSLYRRQKGDQEYSRKLISSLKYLFRNAVALPSYNASLHGNLKKNFDSKFGGCTLSDFKKTAFSNPRLGGNYFYDLKIANEMMAYDPAWLGTRSQGFYAEVSRANYNLSMVEAQIDLFHGWKSLVVELCQSLESEKDFQRPAAFTVRECLRSNLESNLPEAIFDRLGLSRAELAFTLLQQLIGMNQFSTEAKSVLIVAWNANRSGALNLGSALTGSDAPYHRILLRILCLSLAAHCSPGTDDAHDAQPDLKSSTGSPNTIKLEVMNCILEVMDLLVAQGFRSLTTVIHDDPDQITPSDMLLIIAVLRNCLQIPGITDKHASQLVAPFVNENSARYAATLLTWSDQLAINGDPIFAEISISFLVEISNLPGLAESIAAEGILTHILSASVMDHFRRPGGIGPFDEPTRLYSVWSKGILRLALNMLVAIGPPIASEVVTFLNQFRGQLARAAGSFDMKPSPTSRDRNSGYITMAMTSEAQSLAFINTILDHCRDAGSSAGISAGDVADLAWDKGQVKEDVDMWIQSRKSLRECIAPMNEKENAWSRQGPVSSQDEVESLLEEKVLGDLKAIQMILGGSEM